jgi:hypothetical protein
LELYAIPFSNSNSELFPKSIEGIPRKAFPEINATDAGKQINVTHDHANAKLSIRQTDEFISNLTNSSFSHDEKQ